MPELDLALRRVVHADQRFDYVRPLRAGDRVSAVLSIDKVRVRGEVDIIGVSVKVGHRRRRAGLQRELDVLPLPRARRSAA